jgi:hypothetical protein
MLDPMHRIASENAQRCLEIGGQRRRCGFKDAQAAGLEPEERRAVSSTSIFISRVAFWHCNRSTGPMNHCSRSRNWLACCAMTPPSSSHLPRQESLRVVGLIALPAYPTRPHDDLPEALAFQVLALLARSAAVHPILGS